MRREMVKETREKIWRMFFPYDKRGMRGAGELKSFIDKRKPKDISKTVWENYSWMQRALIVEKAEGEKLLQKQKEQFTALMSLQEERNTEPK